MQEQAWRIKKAGTRYYYGNGVKEFTSIFGQYVKIELEKFFGKLLCKGNV